MTAVGLDGSTGRDGARRGIMLRLMPFLLAAAMLALVGLGGWMVGRGVLEAQVKAAQSETLDMLSGMRARLESTVNANLLLAEGIAAFVSANPGLSEEEFESVAHNLLVHRSQIRNITLARGTRMVYVYPEEGNQGIQGLDYRSLPEQWPAVQRAIRDRETVLAGPIDMVQGGRAVVGRTPIFLQKPGEREPTYWGMVAIPIDLDGLLKEAALDGPLPIDVAIRGRDGLGAQGAAFFGDDAVFNRDPVTLDVSLPRGEWQIAATPHGGWPGAAGVAWTVGGGTLFFGLVLAGLVYASVRTYLQTWDVTAWAGDGAHDPLTGLPTSPHFLLLCQQQMTARRRQGQPLAMLVVRPDGLDDVRREFGADAAERLLRAVAEAGRGVIRDGDGMGRLDDDTVAVLLSGVARDGAVMTAERLLRAVRQNWPVAGGGAAPASVCIGVAMAEHDDISVAPLISRALARLKQARAGGRGRIAA